MHFLPKLCLHIQNMEVIVSTPSRISSLKKDGVSTDNILAGLSRRRYVSALVFQPPRVVARVEAEQIVGAVGLTHPGPTEKVNSLVMYPRAHTLMQVRGPGTGRM